MSKAIPLPKPVTIHDHRDKWNECKKCNLCRSANSVVLFRRLNSYQNIFAQESRPPAWCDVLFLGEAPGDVEDALGKPFVGPSGKLLNRIVTEALVFSKTEWLIGFTNIVACIPLDDSKNGSKVICDPSSQEALACRPRLEECIVSAKPKMIICVGQVSKKFFPRGYNSAKKHFPFVREIDSIVHPSAILRMSKSSQPTASARVKMQLVSLFKKL